MEKAERGLLLVEQEEVTAQIRAVESRIKAFGTVLKKFAEILEKMPDSAVFKNAPEDIGQYPARMAIPPPGSGGGPFKPHVNAQEWSQVDMAALGKDLLEMQTLLARKFEVQMKLRDGRPG